MTYESLYERSLSHPEGFWREQAQAIHWFKFPKTILSKDNEGLYRWYKGGKLNTCYLAVDNHVENGRGDQTAIIYDSPATGVKQQYTYRQLQHEVAKFAVDQASLRALRPYELQQQLYASDRDLVRRRALGRPDARPARES